MKMERQVMRVKDSNLWLQLIATLLVLCCCYTHVVAEEKRQQTKKTFIVHMDMSKMAATYEDHFQWYDSSLKSVSESANMLYAYNNIIHGFSTRLTPEEAELLEKQPGILSVLPEMIYKLHTTHSPEFLGLEKSDAVPPASASVSEVIVGVLDTGVWPEIKSFDDTGLGPIPSTWKGTCEVGKNFNSSSCNRKLIGAQYFSKGYEAAFGPIDETMESKSPRDDDGHGTHTATTAAGSAVSGASLFGYAFGTARGMATRARVAAYKVCWLGGCFSSDILAAMEKAVADGVDVISMSIGGGISDYNRDTVAIGAFRAVAQGILVSCSAGNGGPSPGSLTNVAPWITTVGAGTLDRDFPAYVSLGNGKNFSGISLYSGKPLSDSLLPLVYAGNVSNSTSGNLCMTGTLVPSQVAGKIVICDRGLNSRVQKGMVVRDSGGLGMILANTELYGEELVADAHLLPTSTVGQRTADAIKNYAFSDPKPMATIASGGTKLGVEPSPVLAAFSSRGPNLVTPEVLKPDLIAPGVNILAGWTGAVGPTGLTSDKRHVSFNIISGTSMSCPHVSGLAALVKAAHQDWSPAAIKSALMTTAYATYKNGENILDVATGQPSTPFDFGAGHVNPVAALDPGLVYDASVDDYINFFCALNYSASDIKQITNKDFTCDSSKKYSLGDLNYPSFSVPLETASGKGGGAGVTSTVKYTRTLTNVGAPATYKLSMTSKTPSVKILVEPESLSFAKEYEKKTYTVTFTATSMPSGTNSFAHLEWSDGKHVVGSPIAFSWT
ncbi:subtilisin-like protease SBT1.7 [Populus nigra]|uniref:subtilisin-like protease SBT1.7 n=1 Tax=Populus nigra TaxID=3691 RepID=UPI002B27909C|nr:subtilisin-like protease SBT1.7 [Populus nigra]